MQASANAARAREEALLYAEEHAEELRRRRGGALVTTSKSEFTTVASKKAEKKKQVASERDTSAAPASKPKVNSKTSKKADDKVSLLKMKKTAAKQPEAVQLAEIPEDDELDDFPADFGLGSPVPELDDGNDLLNILSQDKASDDSDFDNEPSVTSLILPFAASPPRPVRPKTSAPRALTPTPQKRKRKLAVSDDVDFDFTKKGEKKRKALEQEQVEEEPEPMTVTPKKALKRRKEVEKEQQARLKEAQSAPSTTRNLMQEMAVSGITKVKKTNGHAKAAVPHVQAGVNNSDDALMSAKQKSTDGSKVKSRDVAAEVAVKKKKASKQDEDSMASAPQNQKDKPKEKPGRKKTAAVHDDTSSESMDDVGGGKEPAKPPVNKSKKKDKRDKLSEVEQALRKAEILTRISQMHQDVATPKMKKKKPLKKTAANTLAEKRAAFQQILTDAPATNAGPQETRSRPTNASHKRARDESAQKEPTPPPEKRQFLEFTKGLSKSPMPLHMRSKLKSPVMASPLRRRPGPATDIPADVIGDGGMPSPSYSFGNGMSPRDSIEEDLARAAAADNASRQFNVGVTTRPKKKPSVPRVNRFGVPGGLVTSGGGGGGGGFSMFDAFVNSNSAPIPRLKTKSSGDMSPVV